MATRLADQLGLHPEAGRVPSIPESQWKAFVEDVRTRGVRVPIELIPGTNIIIDGRSRWLAAKECGLAEVPVVDADLGQDDPVVYLLRAASMRRHLTDDQRAILANEEREYLSKKAKKERASKAGQTGGKNHPKKVSLSPTGGDKLNNPPTDTRTQAASAHNVSRKKVEKAQKVAQADPQLAQQVKDGDTFDELPLYEAIHDVYRQVECPRSDSWSRYEQKREDLYRRVSLHLPINVHYSLDSILEAWSLYGKGQVVNVASGFKKIELAVLVARAHGRKCFWANRGKGECSAEVSVDRLIPGSRGGDYSVENCVLSCSFHNSSRSDTNVEDYLRCRQERDGIIAVGSQGQRDAGL